MSSCFHYFALYYCWCIEIRFSLMSTGTTSRICPHSQSNSSQKPADRVLLMQNALTSPRNCPLVSGKDLSRSTIHLLPRSNHQPSKDNVDRASENNTRNMPGPESSPPSSIFRKQSFGDIAYPVLSLGAGILASEGRSALSPGESTSTISSFSSTSTESGSSTNAAIPPKVSTSKPKKSREKSRIELAPDQPPTTQGRPRARVYVACLQW